MAQHPDRQTAGNVVTEANPVSKKVAVGEPYLREALQCVVQGLELRGLTKPEDWPHDDRLYERAVEALAANTREAFAVATDGRGCQCVICIRARRFMAALEAIPQAHHAMLHAMFGALEEAEYDRDHLRAVIDGSWPDADAVIAHHRKRRADTARSGK